MIEIKTSYEVLPYKTAVPVRGKLISENQFLKVTLLEEDYFISVLPGFHESTLTEIAFKVKYFFSHYTLNFSDIHFSKPFFNLVPLDDYLVSVRNEALFNIEVLLLSMLKKTHPGLFNNNEILINELYRPSSGAGAYAHSNCLKIKITPDSVTKTIRLIKELHTHNKDLIIRLDGNRLFELDELISFKEELLQNISSESVEKIDYIEEPLKIFYETFLFQKRSRLKIAMDESFSAYKDLPTEKFPDDVIVVIKPSLYGISTIHNWIQIHPKKRMIISSSFEHPSVRIGLDFLAQENPLEFHGLESYL